MQEDDLIDLHAVPEIFVDNFTRHVSRDGVMSCVGYRQMPQGKVIVIKLVWPAVNTSSAIGDAIDAMNSVVHATTKREGIH